MKTFPIPIARCPRRYAEMTPNGPRSRFCGACQKTVHDLSAMSRAEAARLLASETELCVRFLHDDRGRVVHRGRTKRALAIAALVAAPLLIEACGGAPGRYDYYPERSAAPQEAEDTADGGEASGDAR